MSGPRPPEDNYRLGEAGPGYIGIGYIGQIIRFENLSWLFLAPTGALAVLISVCSSVRFNFLRHWSASAGESVVSNWLSVSVFIHPVHNRVRYLCLYYVLSSALEPYKPPSSITPSCMAVTESFSAPTRAVLVKHSLSLLHVGERMPLMLGCDDWDRSLLMFNVCTECLSEWTSAPGGGTKLIDITLSQKTLIPVSPSGEAWVALAGPSQGYQAGSSSSSFNRIWEYERADEFMHFKAQYKVMFLQKKVSWF